MKLIINSTCTLKGANCFMLCLRALCNTGSSFRSNHGSKSWFVYIRNIIFYLQDCPELQVCLLVLVLPADPIKTTQNNHTSVVSHCVVSECVVHQTLSHRFSSWSSHALRPWRSCVTLSDRRKTKHYHSGVYSDLWHRGEQNSVSTHVFSCWTFTSRSALLPVLALL